MLLKDLVLFFSLFLVQIIFFFLLHILILRFFTKRNLLNTTVMITFISVGLVSIMSYFLISPLFSSFDTYLVSAVGSALAAIFACGLYAFLGPITADRSLACHLVNFVYSKPAYRSTREEFFLCFLLDNFIEKRIDECINGKVLIKDSGSYVLTEHGKRIAWAYSFIFRCLKLAEKDGYKVYFKSKKASG